MPSSFERDTLRRLLREAARMWVIGIFMDTKELPGGEHKWWFYPNRSTQSLDWGDDVTCRDLSLRPMAGKRIRVTMTIEDDGK